MQNTPTISELRAATGISQSYASMILNNSRSPSRALAIKIFRETGWRHEILAGLTEEQIETLETIEPWQSSAAA
jgi:Helix-turn-helix.